MSAAEYRQGPAGDHLLHTARAAFTDGLHLIGWISIVVLVATAALISVLLRHVHPSHEAENLPSTPDTPADERAARSSADPR